MSLATRLYRGEVSYDFVGRRRRWYLISGTVIVICLLSLFFRGLNFGIDFKGGASFQFPAHGHTLAAAKAALSQVGVTGATVQKIGQNQIYITTPVLSTLAVNHLSADLAHNFGISQAALNPQTVGASWGGQITSKAIEGLIIFLIAVVAYISLRFEPKMATAALVALAHDLIVTAGIYSLVGFTVTPDTVIAVLTILGFSLYDTVVVFDKVRENTAGLGAASRTTYSQQANLAVNQTIMRSINTSIVALLPVGALLFVGAGLLGAGTLKELALAQFIGLASGAYSSIFVATPLLAQLKEREPAMATLAARVARAQVAAARGAAAPAVAAAGAAVAGGVATGRAVSESKTSTALLDPDPASTGASGDFPADTGEPARVPGQPAAGGGVAPARVPGSPMARAPGRSGRRPPKSSRNRPKKRR